MTEQAVRDPEAVFEEPWQLEAFSAVVAMTREGLFTWSQWVEDFSKVIANEPQRGEESVTEAYYRQWSTALEIVLAKFHAVMRVGGALAASLLCRMDAEAIAA